MGRTFIFPAPAQPGDKATKMGKTFIFPHQLSLGTGLKRWARLSFSRTTSAWKQDLKDGQDFHFPAPSQPGNKANMKRNRQISNYTKEYRYKDAKLIYI